MVQLVLYEAIQAQAFSDAKGKTAGSLNLPAKSRFVLKPDMFVGRLWTGLILWLLLCAAAPLEVNASTTITFTLDEPCKTSAGVFRADGTLVRTLWNKVPYYAAGTYSATWDGLDNNSNAVAAGTYEIKVLQHNTEYVWDGVEDAREWLTKPHPLLAGRPLQAAESEDGDLRARQILRNIYCGLPG